MKLHHSPVLVAALVAVTVPAVLGAQDAPPAAAWRVTTAVTYEIRRETTVDLIGTPLMPRARGEAEIETEAAGPVRVKVEMRDLVPATQIGPEYLTLVLWAIPPRGRSKNLGEIRLDDGKGELEVTVDVQTFALVVTAEPYYAVTTPSDAVVMENAVRPETRGRTSMAPLQYEIVPRGAYIAGADRYALPAPARREPPDVQQARNAVAIAQIAKAGQYSPEGLATAQRLLGQVEQLVARRGSSRDIISQSRAAVQAAEEARLQSVGRRLAAEAEAARAASAAREAAARVSAEEQAAARREAEAERERAEQAARDAERERERADRARREAETARAEAQAQAARADEQRLAAERERAAARQRLLRQLSEILDTRDSARGLIVNIGDVLFASGAHTLRPEAREKLARFAGIVVGHADLVVQVEGFTDSVGSDALNERLSRQRAEAVASFLIAQGMPASRIDTRGYGEAQPIASNDTAEGRQKNRRVELVVSGEIIGAPIDRPVGTTGR